MKKEEGGDEEAIVRVATLRVHSCLRLEVQQGQDTMKRRTLEEVVAY